MVKKHRFLLVGLAFLFSCAYCFPASNKTDKIDRINSAFDHQRALFQNIKFQASLITPYYTQNEKDEFVKDPTKKLITEQKYQINNKNQFTIELNDYEADQTLKQKQKIGSSVTISFSGQTYRLFSRSQESNENGSGSIFTPQQPFDISKPMIKPTFFMDAVFNDKLIKILKDRQHVTIDEDGDGYWQVKYKDPKSEEFYHLTLDPKQDFMITKMTGFWNVGKTFEKKIQYGKTKEGFYYVKKGVLSINGKEKASMEVTDMTLNGPEGSYCLEFPVGTRITDHTKGSPRTYDQGR